MTCPARVAQTASMHKVDFIFNYQTARLILEMGDLVSKPGNKMEGVSQKCA